MKKAKRIIAKLILTWVALFFVSYTYAQHKSPWNAPESAKDKKNPFLPDTSSLVRGKKSYQLDCQQCHGKDGKGLGPKATQLDAHVADLTSDKVRAQSDGELFWKISEGRTPMPIGKNTLTDDQRWDIINYIRSLPAK